MKRTTGILVTAFAAVFMAVLPYMRHHHHGSEICFTETHCHGGGHTGNEESDHAPDAHHSAHTDAATSADRHQCRPDSPLVHVFTPALTPAEVSVPEPLAAVSDFIMAAEPRAVSVSLSATATRGPPAGV